MSRKALIIVDVQYDFLPPNGSLAVPKGDVVLPFIYELLEHAEEYDVVVASLVQIVRAIHVLSEQLRTLVGHPAGHISFSSTHAKEPFTEINVKRLFSQGQTIRQMLWPDHCIQDTYGSELEAGIKSRLDALPPKKVVYIKKGTHDEVDAYSAFTDNDYTVFTPLAKNLYRHDISDVDIVGLALDYCVKNTAIDARKFGFRTRVLKGGTKAVNPDREEDVLEVLHRDWRVEIIE